MRVQPATHSPLPLLFLLLALALLTVLLFRPLAPDETGRGDALFLEQIFARTNPPPEVAIELTDEQVQDLTAAYTQGFDHPDPGQNDPCERLRLLPYKKLTTWRRQFSRRGFTMEKIRDMLKTGRREPYTHPQKGTTYTKIFDPQGNWIVVDFVDCLIWQVAPYNFL